MKTFFDSRRDFLCTSGALVISRAAARTSGALAAVAAGGAAGPALAQSGAAPLRILCQGPAGSIPDAVARRYSEALAGRRPGGALVDNRPGAAGQIAIAALRQAPADGNTMLLSVSAVSTVYPYLYAKLSYDPDADLKPVSVAAEATLALAVGAAVPDTVRTLKDFVEWAKANPRLVNFGSPGQGTLPHVLSAMFFREAGIDAPHAAYGGGPPAIVDLIGGRIAALSLSEGILRPHHDARKIRVLATSGSTRSVFHPDVPTFVEQGFSNLVIREWFAFYMSGSTPAPLVLASSQAVRAAAESPALAPAFREMGMFPVTSTPEAAIERIVAERRYWKEALAATGIRAES